jgi:hypothetical protein
MAQAHQPRLLGTAPESFDGSADKAIAFWNTLENYYTANAAVYDNEDKKISAALKTILKPSSSHPKPN